MGRRRERQKNICNPISNLIVDPQSDLKTITKLFNNCKINKYNNFEEEEDFDAGFVIIAYLNLIPKNGIYIYTYFVLYYIYNAIYMLFMV